MDLIGLGAICLAFTILLLYPALVRRQRRRQMGLPPLDPSWYWDPRTKLEPWEQEHAAKLAAELDRTNPGWRQRNASLDWNWPPRDLHKPSTQIAARPPVGRRP